MTKPHYVLKAREAVEIPKDNPKPAKNKIIWGFIIVITAFFVMLDILMYQRIQGLIASFGLVAVYIRYTYPNVKDKNRIILWYIFSFIIAFSWFFEANILPWYVLIFAIPLFLWVAFSKEHDKVLFPVEIQFYDDYFIIYREKTYVVWITKYFAREYQKMYYQDVQEAKFVEHPKGTLKFYGKVEIIRHKYNKDGMIEKNSVFHKTIKNGSGHIYTWDCPEIDFVAEIESHSPIKISKKINLEKSKVSGE